MPGVDSPNEDPFSSFIRLLRKCLFFLFQNLFFTILNVICAVLLLVALCLPWRLIGFCNSKRDEMFRTMDQFRSTAILQFAVTCMDIIALPFYLVGLVQPTRFDLSFRAVYIGLTVKGDEPNEPSYEARVILCRNCFAGLRR